MKSVIPEQVLLVFLTYSNQIFPFGKVVRMKKNVCIYVYSLSKARDQTHNLLVPSQIR